MKKNQQRTSDSSEQYAELSSWEGMNYQPTRVITEIRHLDEIDRAGIWIPYLYQPISEVPRHVLTASSRFAAVLAFAQPTIWRWVSTGFNFSPRPSKLGPPKNPLRLAHSRFLEWFENQKTAHQRSASNDQPGCLNESPSIPALSVSTKTSQIEDEGFDSSTLRASHRCFHQHPVLLAVSSRPQLLGSSDTHSPKIGTFLSHQAEPVAGHPSLSFIFIEHCGACGRFSLRLCHCFKKKHPSQILQLNILIGVVLLSRKTPLSPSVAYFKPG